jgi:hypothetical protein
MAGGFEIETTAIQLTMKELGCKIGIRKIVGRKLVVMKMEVTLLMKRRLSVLVLVFVLFV